ncbi:M20 family metallopeptidase [Natronorarus salvus]|uniref:M20 family metallopeptidase n=1 Tax=Natronorarus salvus TaxID=3117733 RepID=UPI002F26A750
MSADPIAFLERAVREPSHESVDGIRELLCETLSDGGVDPDVDEAGNVLATRGDGSPHVVLNTHVDTVPPHVPYAREEGVIRGRGSCDAKGPLAAMLAAFFESDPRGTVTLAVTPDEEVHSIGAAALVDGDLPERADCVIVGEPTDLAVCTAAKGRFQGTITCTGTNAHAAEPGAGENAIRIAARVVDALESFTERPDEPPEHPQLGAPTLTPTTIDGGEATNQVPAECRLAVDRRSVPPETQEGFARALNEHFRGLDLHAEYRHADRETPFLEAFETDPDARVVGALVDAGARSPRAFGAATEASYFASAAPTVVFGPGVLADEEGAVAHGPREYVRTADVERAASVLTEALSSY